MLLIIGTVMFTQEKGSGIMPILRVSKYGRLRTAIAKMLATAIMSVGVLLIFTFTAWALIGVFVGYCKVDNPIQVLQQFVLCPYDITIGRYFLITLFVRILAYVLFAVIIVFFSVLVYHYALTYVCGLIFLGVNLGLLQMQYLNADSILKNLNLIATSTVNSLFVRYRAYNLFGNVVDYVPFMMIVYLASIILLSVSIVWKHSCCRETGLPRLENVIAKHRKAIDRKNRKAVFTKVGGHSRSLFGAEIYKTLIASGY